MAVRGYIEDENGCWIYQGALSNGYGTAYHGGRNIPAHRYYYEQAKGPIPEGLCIDHLCRVPACVNPDHLEAVTDRENILRGVGATAINARKTHCVHGHELVGDNLINDPDGFRLCMICNRARDWCWRHGKPFPPDDWERFRVDQRSRVRTDEGNAKVQAVLVATADGSTINEIRDLTGLSETAVRRIVKRINAIKGEGKPARYRLGDSDEGN